MTGRARTTCRGPAGPCRPRRSDPRSRRPRECWSRRPDRRCHTATMHPTSARRGAPSTRRCRRRRSANRPCRSPWRPRRGRRRPAAGHTDHHRGLATPTDCATPRPMPDRRPRHHSARCRRNTSPTRHRVPTLKSWTSGSERPKWWLSCPAVASTFPDPPTSTPRADTWTRRARAMNGVGPLSMVYPMPLSVSPGCRAPTGARGTSDPKPDALPVERATPVLHQQRAVQRMNEQTNQVICRNEEQARDYLSWLRHTRVRTGGTVDSCASEHPRHRAKTSRSSDPSSACGDVRSRSYGPTSVFAERGSSSTSDERAAETTSRHTITDPQAHDRTQGVAASTEMRLGRVHHKLDVVGPLGVGPLATLYCVITKLLPRGRVMGDLSTPPIRLFDQYFIGDRYAWRTQPHVDATTVRRKSCDEGGLTRRIPCHGQRSARRRRLRAR